MIFGGEAQAAKRIGNSVSVLVWYSPFSGQRSTDQRSMPVYMLPASEPTFEGMVNVLDQAAAWSFNTAADNINPFRDEPGQVKQYSYCPPRNDLMRVL